MTLEKVRRREIPASPHRLRSTRARSGGLCGSLRSTSTSLKPAGLPNDRKRKFHAIRKTVATYVAATRGSQSGSRCLGIPTTGQTDGYIADAHQVDLTLPPRFFRWMCRAEDRLTCLYWEPSPLEHCTC